MRIQNTEAPNTTRHRQFSMCLNLGQKARKQGLPRNANKFSDAHTRAWWDLGYDNPDAEELK